MEKNVVDAAAEPRDKEMDAAAALAAVEEESWKVAATRTLAAVTSIALALSHVRPAASASAASMASLRSGGYSETSPLASNSTLTCHVGCGGGGGTNGGERMGKSVWFDDVGIASDAGGCSGGGKGGGIRGDRHEAGIELSGSKQTNVQKSSRLVSR